MMDVDLIDFLAKVSQKLPCLTYINTRNSSFPKEYQFSKIFSWELADILNKDILRSKIKSVNGSKDLLYKIMRDKFKPDKITVYIEIEIYSR